MLERVKVVKGSWFPPRKSLSLRICVPLWGWFLSWLVIVCLTWLRANSVIGWGVQWLGQGKLYRLIFLGSWTSQKFLVGATRSVRWGDVEATVRLVGNLVLSDAHGDAMETKIDQPISVAVHVKIPKNAVVRKRSWQTGVVVVSFDQIIQKTRRNSVPRSRRDGKWKKPSPNVAGLPEKKTHFGSYTISNSPSCSAF